MFVALGALPRLSGENGPGEIHSPCHLLPGTDAKPCLTEGKQALPRAAAVREVVMCRDWGFPRQTHLDSKLSSPLTVCLECPTSPLWVSICYICYMQLIYKFVTFCVLSNNFSDNGNLFILVLTLKPYLLSSFVIFFLL